MKSTCRQVVNGDFSPVELTRGFSVTLCKASAPHLEGLSGHSLVQLEFQIDDVPWLLAEHEAE